MRTSPMQISGIPEIEPPHTNGNGPKPDSAFNQAKDTIGNLEAWLADGMVMSSHDRKTAVGLVAINGHPLLEGDYGIGKTTLAKLMARATGLSWSRIQGDAETLPSDIIGYYSYNKDEGHEFHPGPIFEDFVLVDEIHRMSKKGQHALIEPMEEHQVTDKKGMLHKLPKPHMVIGTKNSDDDDVAAVIGDRFAGVIKLSNLNADERVQVYQKKRTRGVELTPSTHEEIQNLQRVTENGIVLPDALVHSASTLIDAVMEHPDVDDDESLNSGFRGMQFMTDLAKYSALRRGEQTVDKMDVLYGAIVSLGHRAVFSYEAMENEKRVAETTEKLVATVGAKHLGLVKG